MHAAATPYRERSHFDGQDVLESGLAEPGAVDSGWLNRALAALAAGRRGAERRARPSRSGRSTPLVVRGPAPVLSGRRRACRRRATTPLTRLLDLYRHTDPALARALEERIGLAAIARAGGMDGAAAGRRRRAASAQVRAYFAEVGRRGGEVPGARRTARASARSRFDGWDTHANEGVAGGRLAQLLGALDGAIAAIETGMGAAWRETVVAVVTEFGRTARINGTDGTDHGTGTVALLAGGALKGGRVDRRLAGPQGRRPPRGPRPQADHRPARRAQGPAARITCASTSACWPQGVSRTAPR